MMSENVILFVISGLYLHHQQMHLILTLLRQALEYSKVFTRNDNS